MSEAAQIIITSGVALALVLFASNAPLHTILSRRPVRQSRASRHQSKGRQLSRQERLLVTTSVTSVLVIVATVLKHLL